MRVVIVLGAPGAGKGTQAKRISAAAGLPHVSTGDLFRANKQEGTPLGKRAQEYMDAGKLVPDELVLDMLFDRVGQPDCKDGYLLDGFPRTLPQAEALQTRLGGDVDLVTANLVVADDAIVERIVGRRLCRECGHIYHVRFSPPKVEGKCDADGSELYHRADDTDEVVRERLAAYHTQTEPLVEFYRKRGSLSDVDGDRTPDEVFTDLSAAVLAGEGA
jgi:adenylate kinase